MHGSPPAEFTADHRPSRRLSPWSRVIMAASHAANRRGIYLGRRSTRLHAALYRWSSGRIGGRLPGFPWVPIVLVAHLGAKTGTRRTSPLMCHQRDGVVAVAASKAGQPTHPAWFHNLMAHPDTTIQLGAERRHVRARVAGDEERPEWWPSLVAMYPGYELFQRLAGARRIPIVLFEPRADAARPAGEVGRESVAQRNEIGPPPRGSR